MLRCWLSSGHEPRNEVLEAGKGKETGSPLEPAEGSVNTGTLAQHGRLDPAPAQEHVEVLTPGPGGVNHLQIGSSKAYEDKAKMNQGRPYQV